MLIYQQKFQGFKMHSELFKISEDTPIKFVESRDFKTIYSNQFFVTLTYNEAILKVLRAEPDDFDRNGNPNGIKNNLETQIVMNMEVLKDLHKVLAEAIANHDKPIK